VEFYKFLHTGEWHILYIIWNFYFTLFRPYIRYTFVPMNYELPGFYHYFPNRKPNSISTIRIVSSLHGFYCKSEAFCPINYAMFRAIVLGIFFTIQIFIQSVIPNNAYFSVVKQSDGSVTCPSDLKFFISFPSPIQTATFPRIRCADLCTSYTNCTG